VSSRQPGSGWWPSVAGAGSAQAVSVRGPHHHAGGPAARARIRPDIAQPTSSFSATSGKTSIARSTLTSGGSAALPTVTVTDPGVIQSGDVITLSLDTTAGPVTFDTNHTPTVTETGSGVIVGPVAETATTITFAATKSSTATTASYAVSGIFVTGSAATSGAVRIGVTASQISGIDATVAPIAVAAITYLLPAFYGNTAADTAAKLFRAYTGRNGQLSAVLASVSEPQDAETANYLASNVNTGILLTDPGSLSPAVTATFDAYSTIGTGAGKIYILGGTSVVSTAVENQLIARFGSSHVVRIAGASQYDTNTAVVNYVAANFNTNSDRLGIDFSRQAQYNDTAGTSSPSTTPSTFGQAGGAKTAIVASGDIRSFQDGIVSGPLSYYYGMPVVLTTPTGLTAAARTLLAQGGFRQVVLLGGPLALSDTVTTQLTTPVAAGGAGVTVARVAGTEASDTAQLFARFLTDGKGSDVNMNRTDNGDRDGGVLIARGTGFQDALAAGPYAGENAFTPILLTQSATTLGAPLAGYLKTVGSNDFFSVEAIGGPLSVSTGVQDAAIAAEVSGLGQ